MQRMRSETADMREKTEKCMLLPQKLNKIFGSIDKYYYLCTRIREKVPWMSGLVYGLQNRPRRFESARHLEERTPTNRQGFIFLSSSSKNFLIFLVEQILNLVDLLLVKPLREFLAGLGDDLGIDARPHFLQHIEQHGQIVG